MWLNSYRLWDCTQRHHMQRNNIQKAQNLSKHLKKLRYYCALCLNWKTCFSMRFHFLCFFPNKLFEQCGWNRTICEIARSGIICNETTLKNQKTIQKHWNKLRYYCDLSKLKNMLQHAFSFVLFFFILNKLFEQFGWNRTLCEIARNGIICNRTTVKKHKICQSIWTNWGSIVFCA